jgi:D-alanyl-D-alanine carboxypeptidase
MQRMQFFYNHVWPVLSSILVPILVIAVGYLVYDGYTYKQAQEVRLVALQEAFNAQTQEVANSLASSTQILTASINVIEENLSLTKSESEAIASNLQLALDAERQRVSSLQQETEKIGGTVGNLEKLSQIDPELLMKYSKVFFLNEHYVPSRLSEIRNKYLYSERETKYFHSDAINHLTDMIDAATNAGQELYVKSAYRSFNEQDNLKDMYSVTYGDGANAFSADQGYSEHQLGTTVDLITTGFNGELTQEFDTTSEYAWLQNNAYKYGFILSYPKGNSYYMYEPWHWRFVGVALATKLHNEGKNFYDIDQRVIDEYLISLFD